LDLQLPVQSVTVTTKGVSSNPAQDEVYSVQHYVIKLVSDLQLISGFLRVLRFLPPIKLTCHDITEILLKVALDTITITRFHFIAKCSFGTVKYLNTPNIRVFFFFTHCRWWNS
jgi:hypothetical protein